MKKIAIVEALYYRTDDLAKNGNAAQKLHAVYSDDWRGRDCSWQEFVRHAARAEGVCVEKVRVEGLVTTPPPSAVDALRAAVRAAFTVPGTSVQWLGEAEVDMAWLLQPVVDALGAVTCALRGRMPLAAVTDELTRRAAFRQTLLAARK